MKITLNFPENSSHGNEFPLIMFTGSNRWQRAGKTFLVLLGLSLFSIVIPIFHFILVPGFFFSAFYFAFKRLNEIGFLDLKEFKCPKCHHAMDEKDLVFRTKDKSKKIFCYNCRTYLYFDKN